jgi:hypothetical protein
MIRPLASAVLPEKEATAADPTRVSGAAGWVVRQERGGRAGHTCAVCTQVEVEVSTSYTEGGDAMELRPFVESGELVRSGAEVTSVCTSNCNESEQSNKVMRTILAIRVMWNIPFDRESFVKFSPVMVMS